MYIFKTLPPPTPVNQNLNRGDGKGSGMNGKRKDSDPSLNGANDVEVCEEIVRANLGSYDRKIRVGLLAKLQ